MSLDKYPRALAIGSIAYDTANILGPSLAALVIAVAGFRGNFILDAITFLGSGRSERVTTEQQLVGRLAVKQLGEAFEPTISGILDPNKIEH